MVPAHQDLGTRHQARDHSANVGLLLRGRPRYCRGHEVRTVVPDVIDRFGWLTASGE